MVLGALGRESLLACVHVPFLLRHVSLVERGVIFPLTTSAELVTVKGAHGGGILE